MASPSLLISCVVLLVTVRPQLVRSHSWGPPVDEHFNNVCNLMTPLHDNTPATAGNGGFSIQTDLPRVGYEGFNYTAGNNYTGD